MHGRRLRASLVACLVAGAIVAAPAWPLEDGEDYQVTFTGAIDALGKSAFDADIALNTRTGESLVVYTASPDTSGQYEVFGQRLDASGDPVGPTLPLSNEGEDADPFLVQPEPAVAYSATSDRWLVVFSIDDRLFGRPNDKHNIFGRIVRGDGTVEASRIQISEVTPNGDADHDGYSPDVVWNPDRDEFLIAWHTPIVAGEREDAIWVQRLSGIGTSLGPDTRISATQAQDGGEWFTSRPGLTYDTDLGHYFLVWYAEPTHDDAFQQQEVFGQLLDGVAPGAPEIGPTDFRVSVTGPEGDFDANAGVPIAGATNPSPDVAYEASVQRFLVVYGGNPGTGGLADDEYEAWMQRVTPAGARDGEALRMSEMGTDGSTSESANAPSVAYDAVAREAVVSWWGDPATGGLAADEREIFGQRLIGGVPVGSDFRIGQNGPDGDAGAGAQRPVLAPLGGRYQAVWDGDPGGFKIEIFGDRVWVPIVGLSDLSASEADGTVSMPVVVSRVDAAGVPITVDVALPPELTGPSTLTIPAGASSAVLELGVVQDAEIEGTEALEVTLSNPVGAVLGDASGVVTLADDDGLPGGPPGGPAPPGATGGPAFAGLQVSRARLRRGRLIVLGSLASGASGDLAVRFRSLRFTVPVRAGTFRVRRRLPRRLRRFRTSFVTLDWTSNAGFRADRVRLRLGPRSPSLRVARNRIASDQLAVNGTVARRARGSVRLRLAYVVGGIVREATFAAPISRGRWAAVAPLPDAARAGAQLYVRYPGNARRRFGGQQVSVPLSR